MSQVARETLPRINSQKRFIRPPSQGGEKHTEEGTASISSLRRPKSHSDLHSARRALQSANSSKAACLEATAVIYLKKIQALEKQQFLLDREIRQVKGDIEELRVKRKGMDEPYNSTVTPRCSAFMSKEGPKGKIQNLRKKIDKQNQKMKKLMAQIDKSRRDIQTTKKLNINLEKDLEEWTKKAKHEQTLMLQLDDKMTTKMSQIQQKKISDIQKKTHLIKDYDAILRKLDSQLGKPSITQNEIPSQFYLTDVGHLPVSSSRALTNQSPKGKKIASQVAFLREKAEDWEKQAEIIQERVEVDNFNEVEAKLQEEHNENFHKYKYLNERYCHLDELKLRHEEIKSRKNQILSNFFEVPPSKQAQEMEKLQKQIQETSQASDIYSSKISKVEDMFEMLKQFAYNFGVKSGHHLEVDGEITWENLSLWLQQILKVKNRLGIKQHF